MNIKHLGDRLENNAEFKKHTQHNLQTIVLVVFGSFVLGAIPIIYGLRSTETSSQNAVTVAGEATLWKAVGER